MPGNAHAGKEMGRVVLQRCKSHNPNWPEVTDFVGARAGREAYNPSGASRNEINERILNGHKLLIQ
jgi:hypothetical protein